MAAEGVTEKFWKLVVKETPTFCWSWIGRKDRKGYGLVGNMRAHRLSYELHHGQIPAGMLVRHRCDNPECCNPDHLQLGYAYENRIDWVTRRRSVAGALCGSRGTPASGRKGQFD